MESSVYVAHSGVFLDITGKHFLWYYMRKNFPKVLLMRGHGVHVFPQSSWCNRISNWTQTTGHCPIRRVLMISTESALGNASYLITSANYQSLGPILHHIISIRKSLKKNSLCAQKKLQKHKIYAVKNNPWINNSFF